MRTLTYDEIMEYLTAPRWGAHRRPSLETLMEVLEMLPLVRIEMLADNTLYIETARPLLPSEVWALARLGQVTPERIGDTQVRFTMRFER